MAFFARPNLDNTQFRQLQGGEPLTLSGQTQIATTSGLTLIGDGGMYIPIIATGATNDAVLTYDSVQQAIVLKDASSGSTGTYSCRTPTTCSVGGLTAQTDIFNCSIEHIIECMVSPLADPTLTNPSISCFTITPTTSVYEVGAIANVTANVSFDNGSIDPPYTPTATCNRSNGVSCYVYNAFSFPYECVTTAVSNTYPFPATPIANGSNTISASICYQGGTQPYNSTGGTYCSPLSAGVTTCCADGLCACTTIFGVYPWYWGVQPSLDAPSGVNRPSACFIKDIITGGTACKMVESSDETIQTNFNSTNDDYIWFAIPEANNLKTKWTESDSNKGDITGMTSSGGNLFPDPVTVTGVTTTCWSGQEYKIYISNYQTEITTPITISNS